MRLKLLQILALLILMACESQNDKKGQEKIPVSTETGQVEKKKPVILFFGNSLTAGYGLEPEESFPALIQNRLDSLGYHYEVINAGVSGETTTTGLKRLEWVLEQQSIDIFVLELGANDGLRGIDPQLTKDNLIKMIDLVKQYHSEVDIILAGMMVPPSMGSDYVDEFEKIFPEVSADRNVHLIPFLLENVAGEKELNQKDGIHPTAEGQKILANNAWKVIKEVVRK